LTPVNVAYSLSPGPGNLAAAPVNAGVYSVAARFPGSLNYNPGQSAAVPLIINKANATVVVTAYDLTYNGLSHTATVTSITGVNGETGATVGTVDVSNTAHTDSGTYSSDYWSFTGTANYNNIGPTNVSDTINKAHLTVTADDKTKVYDMSPYSPFTATLSGFVNGETDSGLRGLGALSGAPGFTGTALSAILPGTFTITPRVNTLSATNYDFPLDNLISGTLTITYGTCSGSTPGGVVLQP